MSVAADREEDGVDVLTRIAVLSAMRDGFEESMWEVIAEARTQNISLRRISKVSGISPTHLKRKIDEKAA